MHTHILIAFSFFSFAFSATLEAQCSLLDLDTAIFRALTCSATLKIEEGNALAKEGEWIQASLRPNPTLMIDYDTREWGKNVDNFNEGEGWAVGLSQVFEMGGKRSARTRRGEAEYQIALWDYAIAKLEMTDKVTQAFFDVVLAQEKWHLAQKQYQTLQDMMSAINIQVEAERQSPLQMTRASLEKASHEIQIKKIEREWTAAKQKLSLFWQESCPDFDEVAYAFDEVCLPPFPFDCAECFSNHPSVLRWDSEREAAYEAIQQELAQKIPDVTLQAGVNTENSTSAFFGISFPLPVFNRNQGNIAKAYALADIAEKKREIEICQLFAAAESTYEGLSSLFAQVRMFHDSLFISTRQIFEQIKEGFFHGKFSYLEVLNAQRTLFDTEVEYFHLLTEFHSQYRHFLLLTQCTRIQEEGLR